MAARVEWHQLPIAPGATLAEALDGGEDYELLFTARPDTRVPRRIAGVPVTRIGSISEAEPGEPPVTLVRGCIIEPLERGGWEHFS